MSAPPSDLCAAVISLSRPGTDCLRPLCVIMVRTSGRPGRCTDERSRPTHPHQNVDAFIPVSSVVAINTGLPGRSPYVVIPNFVPDDLLVNEPVPNPDGPIVFAGVLSRDKGIEVLLEAHRRLDGRPASCWPDGYSTTRRSISRAK